MNLTLKNIKTKFFNNRKVAENYFFMTFLQGASLLVGLILYPYLIRVLGKESYGTYVFILSNIQLLGVFVSFGFDMPALKKVSQFPHDIKIKSQAVSEVFTSKFLLIFVGCALLTLCYFCIDFVQKNIIIYLTVSATIIVDILFPSWYFQGIQKMKFVTFVNLGIRILTIPFIFIFIKSPDDLLKYTAIVSIIPLFGGFFTFFYLQIKEKIKIKFMPLKSLKIVFADALPFFWATVFGTIRTQLLTFVIGTFYSMSSVAIYDLANKIVSIPRLFVTSINTAIFPNIINSLNSMKIKKIIKYETIIGFIIIGLIAVFGYWIVIIMGGKSMLMAYPSAVILSATIYTWLIVGCYRNYIFVPQHRYYFITQNQLVAMVAFFAFTILTLLISKNILILILFYTLSFIIEVIYCKIITKKHKLL
jgi:PST family polysaccharide transporter